jgi:hypothetical protein
LLIQGWLQSNTLFAFPGIFTERGCVVQLAQPLTRSCSDLHGKICLTYDHWPRKGFAMQIALQNIQHALRMMFLSLGSAAFHVEC